jgi:hypothetical protein
MPKLLRGNESPEEFVKAMIRAHKSIERVKVSMIDGISGLPWERTKAFMDLRQRLAMLNFCQNNIIIDYPDVQPDHVVVNE